MGYKKILVLNKINHYHINCICLKNDYYIIYMRDKLTAGYSESKSEKHIYYAMVRNIIPI